MHFISMQDAESTQTQHVTTSGTIAQIMYGYFLCCCAHYVIKFIIQYFIMYFYIVMIVTFDF